MADDSFSERRRALEESFFAKRNQELLDKLRSQVTTDQQKEELKKVSGIQDAATLDHMLSAGIQPETFAALSLAPLVLLAWADDFLDPKERRVILQVAEKEGIRPGDACHLLLQAWLDERPDPRLIKDWKAYITSLKSSLPPDSFASLREEILGRARRVAQAAGGLFSMASVSAVEKSVLTELESAFADN
jgi:hypothetical protein